jgi:NSS family neurotransmitter:Na+ symporter
MLITLAIDSAFSLVEAAATVIHDKYPHIRKQDISMYVCVAGFTAGIIFTTSAGLTYLDTTDHFITYYGLVIAGLLETIAIGWFYGAEKLRAYINEVSDIKIGKWWTVFIKYIIPVCLLFFLVYNFIIDIKNSYEGYPQWVLISFGWVVVVGVFLLSGIFTFCSKEE